MSSAAEIVKGNGVLAQLQQKLEGLKVRAESLIIKSPEAITEAKQLKLDIQAYMKAVKFQTGPDIEVKKEELRVLKAQEDMLLAPAEAILKISETKRREAEEEQRRIAQIEQDRKNAELREAARVRAEEERRENERIAAEQRKQREEEAERQRVMAEHEAERQRKAGEINKKEADRQKKEAAEKAEADRKAAEDQEERDRLMAEEQARIAAASAPQVVVKPNIPTVQGVVSRQNWKFRVVNPALVPLTFRMVDEVAIGRMVRDLKDKRLAEKECPGIEVWSE